MIFFPPEGLAGAKVLIRRFEREDITDDYISWLNDPVVTRLSNQRFRRHDRATSEAYLASFVGTPNLFLSIHDTERDTAVGTMTVYADPHHGTADVGILVGDRRARGKGLASDAWTRMVDWLIAQPEVRKVTAGTTTANAPMLALMRKSAMALEGARKAQEIVDREPVDVLYFGRFGT